MLRLLIARASELSQPLHKEDCRAISAAIILPACYFQSILRDKRTGVRDAGHARQLPSQGDQGCLHRAWQCLLVYVRNNFQVSPDGASHRYTALRASRQQPSLALHLHAWRCWTAPCESSLVSVSVIGLSSGCLLLGRRLRGVQLHALQPMFTAVRDAGKPSTKVDHAYALRHTRQGICKTHVA